MFGSACTEEPHDGASNPAAAGAREGMKAYVDPQTGEFTDQAPAASEAAGESQPSGSAPALEERDAPGGGKMVDLQGRVRANSGQAESEE